MTNPNNGHTEQPQSNRQRAQASNYTPEVENVARKPAADRPNAFNSTAWLVEGAFGLLEELRHNDLGLSEKFWQHAYAARRETLLAMRAALDDLIAHTESATQQAKAQEQRQSRRGGIQVD